MNKSKKIKISIMAVLLIVTFFTGTFIRIKSCELHIRQVYWSTSDISEAVETKDYIITKNKNYYVYRYERKLNGIENAVVLLSYPEKAFGNPKALRAFLSTDVSLSTDEILSCYICRWPIEVFFRQCNDKLALDSYQIRSAQGIRRYWLLMSLAHYICVTGTGQFCSFETGYHRICDTIQQEQYRYLFQCARESNDFDSFMKLAV